MEIGYLTKKGMALSDLSRHYIREIQAYLDASADKTGAEL